MELILGKKTYVAQKLKTRALRQAIEINEKIDFNNLKVSDLDELVDFICSIYGNKFDRNYFYDNLDADKLTETLSDSINGIVGGATDKLNTFPTK